MVTLESKYNELKSTLEPDERIFIDVGVPDAYLGEGHFYRHPIRDKNGVPRLEKFYVNPKKAASRITALQENGWREYVPAPAPTAVKRR